MTGTSPKTPEWVDKARRALLELRRPDSGWGYDPDGKPCVEPTALACLGLLATQGARDGNPALDAIAGAADWLARIQKPTGSTGISPELEIPEWPTAYAILTWVNQGGHAQALGSATAWLIREKGDTFDQNPEVVGTDATIPGWPWVKGTYSWLEPTAMAILALRRQGFTNHDRVRDGLRLIRDRAIATGGWNIGCNTVYGKNLMPQPAETGIALLALSGLQAREGMIEKACNYLQQTLPGVHSAQSLCWGVLGLAAWRLRPPEAEGWLEQAYNLAVRRPYQPLQLAYLLLASTDSSLALLGVK